MTVNAFKSNYSRGTSQRLCCIRSGPSNATSAVVGGRCRSVPSRTVITKTAQRDDVEENEQQRANQNLTDAEVMVGASDAGAGANTVARSSLAPSSPFLFNDRKRLPNLSCNSVDSVTCLSVRGIDDPYSNDSLDLKIFKYMAELVRNGTSQERAAEIISQWSGGKGLESVDLRKLRSYFMQTTLAQVAHQHATAVVVPLAATCLSYWSLGQLPATNDAVLPPGFRGALVAVNLMLLVYFASGSLKRAGRVIKVGRAAWEFSSQAELVLLAMWDLAQGHGPLIQAALGLKAVPTPTRSVVGPGSSKGAISAAGGPSAAAAATATAPGVGSLSSAAISRAAVAAQRHSSRTRVLEAGGAAMRHVKRLSKLLLSSSSLSPSPVLPGYRETRSDATPCSVSQKHLLNPNPPAPSSPTCTSSSSPSPSSSLPPPSSSPLLPSWGPSSSGPGSSLCPPTPPPSPTAPKPPLSSLDSYLVLQEAATLQGGFDAVSELGLSSEEAAAAAAMYARYGGSSPSSRFGDYELRRLLQEAGFPQPPLTAEERHLLMLMQCREPPATMTRPGAAGAKAFAKWRCKGWLTFPEWVAWWAATPAE